MAQVAWDEAEGADGETTGRLISAAVKAATDASLCTRFHAPTPSSPRNALARIDCFMPSMAASLTLAD